ncbi:MAG: hypothetical protein ABIR06_04490 [Cyclobacteriaceae bacterium]
MNDEYTSVTQVHGTILIPYNAMVYLMPFTHECFVISGLNLGHGAGNVAMGKSVHHFAGFHVRSFREAEDGALLLVQPELMVFHAISLLDRKVSHMGFFDILNGDARDLVKIHV